MQKYTYICWIHNDAINKDARRKTQEGRRRKTSLQKYIPLTLLQGFERVVQGLHVSGSWRSNINCNILTPLLWPPRCVFLVLLMLGSTPSGFPRAPSVGCGFPYHIWSLAVRNSTGNYPCLCQLPQLPQLPSWLRYIIVQRLHDRPLDLWNRMFNRHQAEINVMQFTGHSLPVHHSVVAPWDLHLVPYYKP